MPGPCSSTHCRHWSSNSPYPNPKHFSKAVSSNLPAHLMDKSPETRPPVLRRPVTEQILNDRMSQPGQLQITSKPGMILPSIDQPDLGRTDERQSDHHRLIYAARGVKWTESHRPSVRAISW